MSTASGCSRRRFLTTASGVVAASTLPSVASAATTPLSSTLRIAVVGVRGRGREHIKQFAGHVVAMCDVDGEVLADRAAEFQSRYDRRVDTLTDYRELVERSDIDAVSIATPNHTHTIIAIAAVDAGKHVYVEKPVSHNVWEGRQLVEAAQRSGRVVQCGTQARSSKAIREAVAWTRAGGLGAIRYAIGTCYKPRKPIGARKSPMPIPASIDYDLWCGPAEQAELFREHLHYDWHWDYNTGAGDLGNQGIHQMDVARWFLGESGLPPRTLSIGGRLGYRDGGETANTQVVILDYPAAPLLFETRGLPRSSAAQRDWGSSMDRFRGSQIGVVVQCEGGHLLVPHTYDRVIAWDRVGRVVKRFDGGGDHFGNFVQAVQDGRPEAVNGSIEDGHFSSALCHLGNVSHHLGDKRVAGEIADELQANELGSYAFERMASHLRANGVEIDNQSSLTLGEWVECAPSSERLIGAGGACPLWKRVGRSGHTVPAIAPS